MSLTSCSDFLEVPPTGVLSDEIAMNKPEEMTTAAYAMLGDCWYTYPFNLWPYGDVASDDAFKGGGDAGDVGGYQHLEVMSTLTDMPGEMDELWYRLYCAISRCNRAINSIKQSGNSVLGAEVAKERLAEARFLRGHFYFKLIQLFNKIPWVDEAATAATSQESIRNDEYNHDQLMQFIVDDFKFAYDNLQENPAQPGRAHKAAAASYLAKCYLTWAYGDGYEATTGYSHVNKDYINKVIEYTGYVQNSSRFGYLEDFGDIFLPEYKNSKESIFAVQMSDKNDDHTTFGRANWSNMLNGCHGIWTCGWDFHKPSQNLVNAFKVDDNGLPMFKDYDKVHNAYPIQGGDNTQKYDPRLFHTVGMPSWPYKYEAAWTLTKDNGRCPTVYGYYTSLKEVPQRSKGETYDNPWQAFAMNDYVFRYSDVMLMRAEALIEAGQLNDARTIINNIRQRAQNSVNKHIAYASDFCKIGLYPESYFNTQDQARECLRWERRLEMAMESSRFFDLRRWGMTSSTLNAYYESEKNDNYEGTNYATYYEKAHFESGKNEYFPVPHNQLYYVPGLYSQNPKY